MLVVDMARLFPTFGRTSWTDVDSPLMAFVLRCWLLLSESENAPPDCFEYFKPLTGCSPTVNCQAARSQVGSILYVRFLLALWVKTVLIEEYTNQEPPSDGEIYYKIRLYDREGSLLFKNRWEAFL